ncbi:hypothetical protein [Aureimonas sp. SK2]|uniref:glycine-rich domain-containing protein n=1 Tax=Aureimonas sp. SK2 TaxID=3015992 RepID=UPI002445064B|nr:hypothetical protein [Aureimonas sp. SK2]
MMNPSYPPGGDGGGSGPAPGGGFMRRRFLGAERILSSGTWDKATALAAPYLVGIPSTALEIEVECVGAGGGGQKLRQYGGAGATPGTIAVDTFSADDFGVTEPVSIGAGGVPGANGGWTRFGNFVQAAGGLVSGGPGQAMPGSEQPVGQSYSAGLAYGPRGPGAGGGTYYNPIEQTFGGASNSYRPRHSLNGGVNGQSGLDARDHWEYGSGGGAGLDSYAAGNGGAPGGGGGASSYGMPGTGGRGEVRLRYYVWETVQ